MSETKKVFVSYCHKQGEWVWDRLVPVLKAGGAEVLIDRQRFEAGKAIEGQMDAMSGTGSRNRSTVDFGLDAAGKPLRLLVADITTDQLLQLRQDPYGTSSSNDLASARSTSAIRTADNRPAH